MGSRRKRQKRQADEERRRGDGPSENPNALEGEEKEAGMEEERETEPGGEPRRTAAESEAAIFADEDEEHRRDGEQEAGAALADPRAAASWTCEECFAVQRGTAAACAVCGTARGGADAGGETVPAVTALDAGLAAYERLVRGAGFAAAVLREYEADTSALARSGADSSSLQAAVACAVGAVHQAQREVLRAAD